MITHDTQIIAPRKADVSDSNSMSVYNIFICYIMHPKSIRTLKPQIKMNTNALDGKIPKQIVYILMKVGISALKENIRSFWIVLIEYQLWEALEMWL